MEDKRNDVPVESVEESTEKQKRESASEYLAMQREVAKKKEQRKMIIMGVVAVLLLVVSILGFVGKQNGGTQLPIGSTTTKGTTTTTATTTTTTTTTITSTTTTTTTNNQGGSQNPPEDPPHVHTAVIDRAVDATCTKTGLTEGKHCSECGDILVAQQETPMVAHTYDNQYDDECNICGHKRDAECGHFEIELMPGKAATCTTTGLTDGAKCKKCAEIITAQTVIPIKSHEEVDIPKVEATCTKTGLSEGKKCLVCGTITVPQVSTPMKAHTEVIDVAVEATCTKTGLTEGKHCSVCYKTLVEQQVSPKIAHTYDDKYDATCNKCGTIRDVECPHTQTEVVKGNAATCTTAGLTDGTKCKNCGTIIVTQTTIAPLGHIYDKGVIISEATCTSNGTIKYSCTNSNCDYSYTDIYTLPTYTASEIYNQAVKYVGEITVYDKSGYSIGTGTGFVMSSDGKIITNYHVIDGACYADIVINGTKYNVSSVLAYDANIDLAILKINANGLTAANICKNAVKTGETVYAIGSSRGLTNTYSQGIVTYANRVIDGVSYVQHDASITHGNSGGPLINTYGEVIGINTWGISDSQNLNFAVFTSELDNLSYLDTPITLQELYEKNHSAYETLLNWVLENYNYTGNNYISYRYQESGERFSVFSLTYYPSSDTLSLVHYYVFDNDDARYVSIDLSEDITSFRYYATYTDGDYSYQKNVTQGYIYPSSFTRYTSIGYYSFEGDYWTESSLLNTYHNGMVYSLEWFEAFLNAFDLGLTLADFGFSSF